MSKVNKVIDIGASHHYGLISGDEMKKEVLKEFKKILDSRENFAHTIPILHKIGQKKERNDI